MHSSVQHSHGTAPNCKRPSDTAEGVTAEQSCTFMCPSFDTTLRAYGLGLGLRDRFSLGPAAGPAKQEARAWALCLYKYLNKDA